MSSVYLGDIDPNNKIISPLKIRRNILFKLLFWDSIVFSDSQFLTDPRINILMGEYDSKNLASKLSMEDVRDDQRGIEKLINSDAVKVAIRKKNSEIFTLEKLYDDMKRRTSPIPYLPERKDYPQYLDSLSVSGMNYDLDSIADMFRKNLLTGVGTEKFPNTTRIENELAEMFQRDKINFSSILDFLKKKLKNNEISAAYYDKLYDYVYSCYSINISAQTGCYISTQFKDIPLHIDCGAGDFVENVRPEEFGRLRKTWALNPAVLDEISFDDFVVLKQEINKIKNLHYIMDCFNGILSKPDSFDEFYDVWEVYTFLLERVLSDFLRKKQTEIFKEAMKYSSVELKQKTILTGTMEIVESAFGFVPIVGDTLDVIGLVKSGVEYVRHISNKAKWNDLVDKHDRIDSLLSPNTKIITKFENCQQ